MWCGALWICLLLSAVPRIYVSPNKANYGYKIGFHKDCGQPVLTGCPQDVSTAVVVPSNTGAGITPQLTIARLQDQLVGQLSWKTNGPSKDLVKHFYLRLTLSMKGSTTDIKCLNVTLSPNEMPEQSYCITMIPNNIAQLTMDVILSHDPACDCDVTNMAARLASKCKGCSPTQPVVTSVTVDIGKKCCLVMKTLREKVNMKLSALEITPQLLQFELYAQVKNVFARAEVSVHADDVYNPEPILHLYKNPDENGEIYFTREARPYRSSEEYFYAKLCLLCSEDERCKASESYMTAEVKRKPIPKVASTTVIVEYASSGVHGGVRDSGVIIGAVTAVVMAACLATIAVWLAVLYNRGRTAGRSPLYCRQESNNSTATTTPLNPSSPDANLRCPEEPVKLYNRYVSEISGEKCNMILYHPDSSSHQKAVDKFVQKLDTEGIGVEGLAHSQSFENWRDFAEKAGETYTNIIAVYSQGLDKLLTAYPDRGGPGDDSEELWQQLLKARSQEYIPCVVLTKLKYLYQHGSTSFSVHFVLLDYQDRSKLNELISKHFSFLRGNNFKVYSLPFVENDSSSNELNLEDASTTVFADLIQNLMNSKQCHSFKSFI